MRYKMKNDSRASSVAKDLVKIAKERNLSLSLAKAQEVVAVMLGYTNWRELKSLIGTTSETGPEDSELDAIALSARRAEQKAALANTGFDPEQSEIILARLRPTGRTADAIAGSRTVARTSNVKDYHPNRVRSAWQDLYDFAIEGFDGSYEGAALRLHEWMAERHVHPLDLELPMHLRENDDNNTVDIAFLLGEDTGFVIDGSALAASSATDPIDDSFAIGLANGHPTLNYVHLGYNAFPSPYWDAGIEGVYIEVFLGRDKTPDSVCLQFVTSDPHNPASSYHTTVGEQLLRNVMRSHSISYDACEGESLTTAFRNIEESSDAVSRQWAPYVRAPAIAAINILSAYMGRKVAVNDAVSAYDYAQKDTVKAERAATDAAFFKALKDGDDTRFLAVRHLARPAPSIDLYSEAKPSSLEEDKIPSHFAAVHIIVDDSFGMDGADTSLDVAAKAVAMSDERMRQGGVVPMDTYARQRALSNYVYHAMRAERLDDAVAVSRQFLQEDRPSWMGGKFLLPVWAAFHLAGHAQEALAVEREMHETELLDETRAWIHEFGADHPTMFGNFVESEVFEAMNVKAVEYRTRTTLIRYPEYFGM